MGKKVEIKPKPRQQARTADEWVSGATAPASSASPVEEKPALAKVTMYVRPEQLLAVEEIQLSERKRTGKRLDKSDLYQEALDLLIKKHLDKN